MTATFACPAVRHKIDKLGLRTDQLPGNVQVHGPADLPLHADGERALFRLWYLAGETERYVVAVLGDVSGSGSVMLRIESACTFGHIFSSGQCDCGWQWRMAIHNIIVAKRGLLIYGVDQDARGLGIAAHFDIYRMRQQESLDTADVFKALGAPWDNRTYQLIPVILRSLGVSSVALLSNNATRLSMLREAGFSVMPTPLEAELTIDNMSTLMLEKEDLGYSWSFLTHADNLESLQPSVLDSPELTAVAFAAPGGPVAATMRVASEEVLSAAQLMAESLSAADRTVLYMTDLPRLDELPGYAALGARVIVVPFPLLPILLRRTAVAAGLRLVDWSRRNAWPGPRPQWIPLTVSPDIHAYRRDPCGIGPPLDDTSVRAVELVKTAAGTRVWRVNPDRTADLAAPGFCGAEDMAALETVVAGWSVAHDCDG